MKKILALLTIISCVGCANLPQNTNQQLLICDQGQCHSNSSSDADQLLNKLHKLLESNSGKATICSADAVTHQCQKPRVCYFVLGGILPGNGCANQLIFKNIKSSNKQLLMQTHMPLKFIGTPVNCKIADANLTLESRQTLSLKLSPHFCSWMAMGVMTAELNFHIDWVNLDTGELGGKWFHRVKGTGNGKGSGYMILQFSH